MKTFKIGDKVKIVNQIALHDLAFYFTVHIKEGFPNLFTISDILPDGFIELKELKERFGSHGYEPSWFIIISENNPSHRLNKSLEKES